MKSIIPLYMPNNQFDIQNYQRQLFEGLSKPQKTLPTKYRYDEEGSQICSQINYLEAYYPFEAEKELIHLYGVDILNTYGNKFSLVQLGSGDGVKTRILLEKAISMKLNFQHIGIDISEQSNKVLLKSMSDLPELHSTLLTSMYEDGIDWVDKNVEGKRVFLMIGSNLSNSTDKESIEFLIFLSKRMKRGDLFSITHDIATDPRIIQKAYFHDLEFQFIMNNLKRINRELDGHFELEKFYPHSFYDPCERAQMGCIISQQSQSVIIKNKTFCFQKGEILTVSMSKRRYPQELNELCSKAGLTPVKYFTDSKSNIGHFIYVKSE